MCICLEPAQLTSTIIVAHQTEHEGRQVNVVGYMNTADSASSDEPNAMILPIPSASPMSSANCIDMTGTRGAFEKYARIFDPPARGRGVRSAVVSAAGPGFVEVFDSGSYTVALTRQAQLTDLRRALEQFPEDRRIHLNMQRAEVFRAFRRLYPDWHLAVCAWRGRLEGDPILWWYDPMPEYEDRHFIPGLDAHDGKPPNPGLISIEVDHTLVVGDLETKRGDNAMHVFEGVPEHLWKWLPTQVYGARIKGRVARNGDWIVPKSGWTAQNMEERLRSPRSAPPGYRGA
jgi:hypothetical protein